MSRPAVDGGGEPDIARVASAFADPRRVRVLVALADGRALPAGRLAEEAGVSASTASNHLAVLLDQGLVAVEQQGRRRYYRLASSDIEAVLEALSRLAPKAPITSLRAHTRAAALREGRTCYHHLAGGLGVTLFRHIIGSGWVVGGDGVHRPDQYGDRLSSPGKGTQYRVTPHGAAALASWGVSPEASTRDAVVRYCIDWTEQAHHLAGDLGAAVAAHFLDSGWIVRGRVPRSVQLTEEGRAALTARFGADDFGPDAI